MAIFHLNSYRDIINQKLKEHASQKGYKTRLSKAMNILPSHLSQVLSGRVDLSPDQGSYLCDEWNFSRLESDYFLTLIHLERAGTESLKIRVRQRIEDIRKAITQPDLVMIDTDVEDGIDRSLYFASWINMAVHVALIEQYRDEASIARKLQISPQIARSALLSLQDMKMACFDEDGWKPLMEGITTQSRVAQATLHAEFRKKAHEEFISGDTEIIRMSSLSTLSTSKYFELRNTIRTFINEYVEDASEETDQVREFAVFNLDFYRIGRESSEEKT